MKRVALIGPPERAEIDLLGLRLEERSAEALVLDSTGDPAFRLGPAEAGACGVDLRDVQGVYVSDLGLRSPVERRADRTVDREASLRRLPSCRRHLAAWNALLAVLAARCRVVNPPHTHDLHTLKPWEIGTYERLGLPTTATLATSDPAALCTPPPTASDAWIRKGMIGGYGYTEEWRGPTDEAEAKNLLAHGPLMVQERIEGTNVRAFVLGGEVIGAAESSPLDADEVDSRRGDARLRKVVLDDDAARLAVAAAAHWGLGFAAVDLMRDEIRGRFCLLECNSAPFFVNFERRTGIDVSGRLADYLLGRTGAGR